MLKLREHEFFRRESQFVVVEPRTPQPLFPLHEHDFHELVIVASGNGWHVLNDEPHLLSCGEVFYLEPEDRHAFDEVHDLHLTNVIYRSNGALLHPDRLRPYVQPGRDPSGERRYWQVSGDLLGRLNPLLAALERESQSPDAASELMAQALFVQLIVALWRDRSAGDGESRSPMARLAHVLSYLRDNCEQPIDLDELAHRFGYSSRNFRRVFYEATASTPHDYLVKLRLGRAMRALRSSDAKITDVAFTSGFNDSNYFSYAFKKLTGVPPSRYRQQTREHEGRGAATARRDASSES